MKDKDLDRIDKKQRKAFEALDEMVEAYDVVLEDIGEKYAELEEAEDDDDRKMSPERLETLMEQIAIERMKVKALEELAIRALDRTGISCSSDAIGG